MNSKQFVRHAVALASLAWGVGLAQAQTITAHDVSAAPGTSIVLPLDVDFGLAGIHMVDFTFSVQFDPTLLDVSIDGFGYSGANVADVEAAFATGSFLSYFDPFSNTLTGTWSGLSNLDLEGTGSLNLMVSNTGLTLGQTTAIQYTLSYDDENFEPQGPFAATSTITSAIPEPESAALALAGLVVLGAWARRRSA